MDQFAAGSKVDIGLLAPLLFPAVRWNSDAPWFTFSHVVPGADWGEGQGRVVPPAA